MPRSFFSRVFLQSVFSLLALLAVGGFALDRFLSESEIARLGDQVERFALLLKEDAARCGEQTDLQPLARRMGEVTGVRFTVVDKTGRVLADSLLDPAGMENHADHPEVARALAGTEGRNLRRSASLGIEMLYVAVPGERVFRAAVPVSEVRAVISEVRRRIVVAALPAVLIALLLAYGLARALTNRVGRMKDFTLAMERGEYDAALHARGDDELADMERGLLALRGEIRRQLQALRQDKAILAGLVEGFPHAVLLFDGRRNLTLANAPARALLRLPDPPPPELHAGEVFRHPKVLEALNAVGRSAPEATPFRLEWIDPPTQLEVGVHALPGDGEFPEILVVLRDVSREVHLERVRSDFIVNLSHELRTPLTAIRGSAETLLDGAPAESSVSEKFLKSIRRNALRLEALLRDLSDLSRAEAALETLEPKPLDAREPVRHVLDLFAGEAQRGGIALRADLPDEPVPLVSDADKIEQILVNLVQNAVRYTPGGGSVTVGARVTGEGVLFTVADTGIGIPPQDLPRVTERFYRVDPGRSRALGGTGLGLSIVKHLAETLRGKLELASERGAGTTASVTLPFHLHS